MIYRDYGTTGKRVSLVGFGGMRFRDIDNRDQCVETMLAAARGGVNFFDTAPGYFGTKSEEVFGEAFAEMRRQGLPFYASTKTFAADEKAIRTELDAQLKRMQVDRIDFYHVWCVTSLANWAERKAKGVREAFVKLKEEGLIGHICVSSHLPGSEIQELLPDGPFEGVLFGYSAYNFHFRQVAFEIIRERNLGCAVMNPLGGGLIPQNADLFAFVKTRDDETVVEAALRFLFAHEGISTVLVGAGDAAEMREALAALEGDRGVSREDLARIRERIGVAFADLCTGCRYCENCPEEIPVSKFMQAYNQYQLRRNARGMLGELKWHWCVPPDLADRCTGCGECETRCTQHLAIVDRLREIVALEREDQAKRKT